MDLKGKYYRIMHMRQHDEVNLHQVLFRKQEFKSYQSHGNYGSYGQKDEPWVIDKKFIMETDLMSDWPYGRAIFVNEDQTFIVNVGNIDHLEIKAF